MGFDLYTYSTMGVLLLLVLLDGIGWYEWGLIKGADTNPEYSYFHVHKR